MNNGQENMDLPTPSGEGREGKKRLTLRKGEKLRHRSLVEPLFREGNSLYEFPLRMTWRVTGPEELEETFRDMVPERIDRLQMLITIPKRKRRHAVDRVLLRRRIREAYRLNRLPLKERVESDGDIRTLSIALIYMHDKNLPYSTIETKLKALFRRLASKLDDEKNS